MSFLNRLKGFFKQSKDEEIEAKIKQLSEEELIEAIEAFELTEEELAGLRKVFSKNLVDFLTESEDYSLDCEKGLRFVFPSAFLNEILRIEDDEEKKAMDPHLYPKIVNAKNKILKVIPIEEIEIEDENRESILQLSDKLRTQRLYLLEKQWPKISEIAEEINQAYAIHRYAKVNQSIKKIKESYSLPDRERKKKIQDKSEEELNSSINHLFKKVEDHLDYFRAWESRADLNNDYSVKAISRNFNQLMRDYLFYTAAKGALVHLKNKEGMNRHSLFQLTEELDQIDREFKYLKMDNWLAPTNRENSWQHKLFKRLEMTNKEITIDCQRDLLKEKMEENEEE